MFSQLVISALRSKDKQTSTQAKKTFTEAESAAACKETVEFNGEACPFCTSVFHSTKNLFWYSLFLQEVLLLLSVWLYCVLRQELHEFQRLFDFYQNLIDFASFNLRGTDKTRGQRAAQMHPEPCETAEPHLQANKKLPHLWIFSSWWRTSVCRGKPVGRLKKRRGEREYSGRRAKENKST